MHTHVVTCETSATQERCGEALGEMERMRADMLTLAAQLQDAEERALAALEDTSGAAALTELRATLRGKEGKLRALRGALVRLKQEFIKAEEAREDAALRAELQVRTCTYLWLPIVILLSAATVGAACSSADGVVVVCVIRLKPSVELIKNL
jgi:hypothetical protein